MNTDDYNRLLDGAIVTTPEQIAAATAYVKARAGEGAVEVLKALELDGAS